MANFGQADLTHEYGNSGALGGYIYFAGGTAVEAGTLTSVTVHVSGNGSTPANAYIGVYKGASMASATLIAQTANITAVHAAAPGSGYTYNFRTDDGLARTFSASDKLWLCFLNVGTAYFLPWLDNSDTGDFATFSDTHGDSTKAWGYWDTGSRTSLPSTAESANTGYLNKYVAAYLTYTAGASGVSKLALLGVG